MFFTHVLTYFSDELNNLFLDKHLPDPLPDQRRFIRVRHALMGHLVPTQAFDFWQELVKDKTAEFVKYTNAALTRSIQF